MSPDATYFLKIRRDIAMLVPFKARKVLDVGCGFGALGKLLVSERGCVVHGVEHNPKARQYLAEVYANYVIGDIESSVYKFADERYDCIIFADILEHLVDPLGTLKAYSALLAPQGAVVASIPNVRNLALLFDIIIRGRWQYKNSGLLDRSHLRFFTRAEIYKLFHEAGLIIERIEVNRDRYRWPQRILSLIPTLFMPDLAVCQFRVVARRQRGFHCSERGKA
jgi:2-polyprenyl-3-methyl-5-hydroxy-6-metoxy-1,4-benzoquinol methylase